jgi:hypothetical protein
VGLAPLARRHPVLVPQPRLIHGYKEPHENKLPLNRALGVGVTLVPAVGWQGRSLGFAASMNGTAFALRASWSFQR